MRDLLMAVLGIISGSAIVGLIAWLIRRRRGRRANPAQIVNLIAAHFRQTLLDNLVVSERRFPFRVRADLQRAIDDLFGARFEVCRFAGVKQQYSHVGVTLADCLVENHHNPVLLVPPQFEEIDVGDDQAVRTLKNGLWLLACGQSRFVVLLAPVDRYGHQTGMQIQVATIGEGDGPRIRDEFFRELERAVLQARSYRGKILSLEASEDSYSGHATGIKVHKLRTVEREQVILPAKTLDLLDRNVIHFVRQRPQLARFRQATKKGILFYGPPGTGKTHTIHYLARALEGHTTLLITAEQVGLLSEYMTLARLLQPSIVVMEDVDLVARERGETGVCQEVVLNKLLNEMDGLREEADILFILTTNRPESLEPALASRPGRVDQAIEFPLPDDDGRRKLVKLYSADIGLPESLVDTIVGRTERVSAAFIKELMRRSVQFHLERNGTDTITLADVEAALEEMLFSGGTLNLKLLGAEQAVVSS